ncbi:M15 family peptidase [Candidatus Pacearchaeota archaeon]|nr:M15 family peptidase [Candidatus Pacearchaeota archaeon]
MTLRQKQSIFAKNISILIVWAYDNGYEITFGEAKRTRSQQYLYFYGYTIKRIKGILELVKTRRRSKTMNSFHIKKLAKDLNIFINGKYRTDKKAFKPLAEKWSSLHPDNVSGYDWGWDLNHFQMG